MTLLPPVLETGRLILRPMTLEDARDVFLYASDPEVTRHVMWEKHRSPEDSRRFLQQVVEGYARGELLWGVVLREEHRLIGSCGYDGSWVREHRRAEIGYVLSRDCWRKGYMTEAVLEMIRYGFENMGLNRVIARCFAENRASERVMQKAGMTFEGTQREHVFVKGAYRDLKLYSMLRREFSF